MTEEAYAQILEDRKRLVPAPAVQTPQQKMYALGRLKEGERNKTEQSYEDLLNAKKTVGEIRWFEFEGMKFRLADRTFYTPDFMVMLANGELQAHEVKGFWTDDALVKIKVAAELYPIRFIAVRKVKDVFVVEREF